MITWLSPAALIGLAAVAGPILVHLLRRRQARRVIVPSVRFIVAAEESSVHLWKISDLRLLLVRIGIIVAAVLALAQPLLVTRARAATWAERVSRAVLVDASESARLAITEEAIRAQAVGADRVTRVDARDLAAGLKRAAAWLAQAPPSRREIVILSDFQRGALAESDIMAVSSDIGIRLIRSASSPSDDQPPLRVLSGGAAFTAAVDVNADRTAVTYSSDNPSWSGLELVAGPASSNDVTALRRVLSRAGVHAPASERPISIRFGGATEGAAEVPAVDDWTFGAGQRLLDAVRGLDVPVNVSSRNGTLLVEMAAEPGSLAAAQVTAAALKARIDPEVLAEREPAVIPQATLTAWAREPMPADPGDWSQTDSADGRYLWAVALLLLGVESRLRARTPRIAERTEQHAA